MRRHSVIVRLGPTDTTVVRVREPESVITEIRFIDGDRRLAFGLGQIMDGLIRRGLRPTDTAVDLTLLAGTVTAADTRISRHTETQDSWTREIDLYIPVADLASWRDTAPLIERILNFLSGDHWRLSFRDRHPDYEQIIQEPEELVTPPFDCTCLFSGGLDSFTGAIDLLEDGKRPIFVSHYWDAGTSSQPVCAKRLGDVYGDMEPRWVRARVGFPDDLVAGSEPEKTQRGRSFLFFSLAVLSASALEEGTIIYVPENGLISLNIPLDRLRIGAWSTRTTHPFYLARWQDLLGSLGMAITIENPYRFQTKGEMLSNCANKTFLRQNLHETISCSSVTKARWMGLPLGHCGYCVPCIIRRAAIQIAFGTDSTEYRAVPDLIAHPLNSKAAEGKDLRSFQMMVERLNDHPALARILVHKTGPLSNYSDGEIAAYADVFKRGIDEVGSLIEDVVVRPL